MKETPLPFTVRAMIIDGRPAALQARSTADAI
jgi:hypothetical protein